MAKRVILLFAAAVFWFSLYIYIPYLTPELLAIGVSASLTGVIVALHSIFQMVMRFDVGLRSGATGRHKLMIVLGMLLAGIAALVMCVDPSPWLFAIGNAISGFSSAMYVGITVLYARYYASDESNKAMAYISVSANVGILAAFLIGGFAWDRGGIRQILIIAIIAAVVGLVVSLFVKDVQMPPTKDGVADLKVVIKNRQLVVSSLLCVVAKLVVFGTAFAFTPKIAQDIGASGAELGVINALFIGLTVAGNYMIASKVGRRLGDARLAVIDFVCLAVYSILTPFSGTVPVLMGLQCVGGFGYGGLTAIFMANAVRKLPAQHKSTGMGVYQGIYSGGSALGPIIIGLFTDYVSKSAGFIAVGILAAAAALLVVRAQKQQLIQ